MDNKSNRIEKMMGGRPLEAEAAYFRGYVERFNRQEYYEAHDVLEAVWLEKDRASLDYRVMKGLIQLAGGFVHLQKHFGAPEHRAHGRRLPPGYRLFGRALDHFEGAGSEFRGLDMDAVRSLCEEMRQLLEAENWEVNPWTPERAPKLEVQGV